MKTIRAAVGILADRRGRLLVAQRPTRAICAGKWEFPGGKIEDHETPRAALEREIREELGVEIELAERLLEHVNTFPDRVVRLDVWLVRRWRGEARGNEGQRVRWVDPGDVPQLDFLPGVDAILPEVRQRLSAPG